MPERFLSPDDLVLIDLVPMETSTREDVAACLEDAATRTSVPRVIVDDHGVDLNGGVQIFQRSHPDTVEIYDAKHKAACLLKARPGKEPALDGVLYEGGTSAVRGPTNGIGRMAPPGSKPKARFMNLAGQLNWADKVLAILDGLPGTAHPGRRRNGWKRNSAGYESSARTWPSGGNGKRSWT